jgi:prepilin peptidase CpaA
MILTGDPSAALYTLAASAGVFTATFLLFWRGFLGGGDVKLMAATALLVGYHDLFEFLFVMSVCGALVSLAVVAGYRLGLRRATVLPAEDHHKTSTRPTVPYGVAIAAAGILTLLLQSSVPG